MSISHTSSIVTNGLVFAYDMANTKKSWKGQPATNLLLYSNSMQGGVWSGYCAGNMSNVTYNTTDLAAPDGSFTALKIVRDTGTVCGSTGTWGMLYGGTGTFTSGQTYTVSVWARCAIGSVGVTLGMNDSFGGGITLTPEWKRFSYTATITSNLDRGIQFIISSGVGTCYFWGAQLELGSYATPYMSSGASQGSRSNTQAVVDLIGTNTITATSLTYASDGSFSFNGSSDYLISTNTGLSHGKTGFTYSCWVKWSSITSLGTIFENGLYTNGILIRFETNLFHIYADYTATTYNGTISFTPTIGVWYNLSFVRDQDIFYLYVNGTQSGSVAFGTSLNVTPSTSYMYIGRSQHTSTQYHPGNINNVTIYNRALSAAEVKQNFNALRGRYGI